jgi:hypothetical protein
MNFTYANSKWKGPATKAIFPSNSRPITNVNYADLGVIKGPWPNSKPQNSPQTITKIGLIRNVNSYSINGVIINENNYYSQLNKSVTFGQVTCTTVGTSLPNNCRKSLPRPLKIWRKQLNPYYKTYSNTKVTLNQINGVNNVVTTNIECSPNHHVIQEDINHLSKCDGIKNENKCIGGTNKIRRNGGASKVSQNYCTTTREYLKRRVKSYEQNSTKGKQISGTAYKSAMGVETGDVTGTCNKIYYNPSNSSHQTQGGVDSSTQTTKVKFDSIMALTTKQEYAIAQSTIDSGFIINGDKKVPNDCYVVIQDRAKKTCS